MLPLSLLCSEDCVQHRYLPKRFIKVRHKSERKLHCITCREFRSGSSIRDDGSPGRLRFMKKSKEDKPAAEAAGPPRTSPYGSKLSSDSPACDTTSEPTSADRRLDDWPRVASECTLEGGWQHAGPGWHWSGLGGKLQIPCCRQPLAHRWQLFRPPSASPTRSREMLSCLVIEGLYIGSLELPRRLCDFFRGIRRVRQVHPS